MTIVYIILAYCIITAIIAAYIALFISNKKQSGFFPTYLSVLGGPVTLVIYLLRLKTRKQERAYYKRKYFQ